MNEMNIFRKAYKYGTLFIPDYINSIDHILYFLNYNNSDFDNCMAKSEGLNAIKQLLELDIIYVYHWGEKHSTMNNKKLSIEETMAYVDKIWFEGANSIDFIGMITFNTTSWYREVIKRLGFDHFIDWETFVKEKIGNLEKWINENRPKEKAKTQPLEKTDFNIFKIGYVYINLFEPDSPKLLRNVLFDLDYDTSDFEDIVKPKTKKEMLQVFQELLELNILKISWGGKHSRMNNKQQTVKEVIAYLDEIWKISKAWLTKKKDINFVDAVTFNSSGWYRRSLAKAGYSQAKNWEWFVENKIGNLEKWIEENKPKE